ncbi:MAG: valine--tRNA ligase [Candidatus Micrarchaeota archaeon]|nr:valine--tRNA ligase [Candidatus Micrarchaeota archaeon]
MRRQCISLLSMYDISVDERWNRYWLEHKLANFDENDAEKPIYVIDSPPPFTSGTLHMGHVSSYSFVDFMARYKRMKGFNVLYPQGWDTQGFPTEKAAEAKFGISLPREEFYKRCSEIAHENLAAMKAQMRLLGCSFDERYEYITMTPEYRAKVQLSLLMMHDKKLIYREKSPVEWCTRCLSAIAHAETEEKSVETNFVHVNFEVVGTKKHITIATTRPELMHACVALAVNGNDDRYKDIIGKKVAVPLFGQHVEIIADDHVDAALGTGAEMVCTFGDKVDREMYYRHKLKYIEAIDQRGRLANADKFSGMKISDARPEIVKALEAAGAVVKIEKITHSVKVHDRCGTEIELIPSMQWFIKVKEFAGLIKDIANDIGWTPEFTKQYLIDWANFIDWDWIISRNRVFGTPIPFWYCEKCGEIIAPEKAKLPVNPALEGSPLDKCPKCGGKAVGETATCDVWVDSSITPLVITGWPDNKELFKRSFPVDLRVQGTEIVRTWAFYTIFRSWALTDNKPFEKMLVHGMVLRPDGKRMSKSKGTGISPEELLKKYPVSPVRLWAALSSAIGKDKPILYNDFDYAKSFIIKLFNSAAFVKTAIDGKKVPTIEPSKDMGIFDVWILNRLNTITKLADNAYDTFAFYEAANAVINFYWHEFCDYYLENVKHRVYSTDKKMEKSRHAAVFTLHHVLMTTLKLLTPIIPHITEEVNSMFNSDISITLAEFPKHTERKAPPDYAINGIVYNSDIIDEDYENVGAFLNTIIAEVRKAKASARIALNKEIPSININVPEEYYKAAIAAKGEIAQICKAQAVEVAQGVYSVSIKV